jgi:phenylpropionate dioxygenase-like ring-hydroxylating dioxygenase large terminal subunit
VYECYWPVSIENALEPQHLSFIHPNTLGKLKLNFTNNKFWKKNSAVYFEVGDLRLAKSIEKLSKIYSASPLTCGGYMSIFLYPFSFISSTGGTTYSIQNFFPRDEESTWFWSRLYSVALLDSGDGGIDRQLISSASEINEKIFEEDHDICKRISKESWESKLNSALYVSEEKIVFFRNELLKD